MLPAEMATRTVESQTNALEKQAKGIGLPPKPAIIFEAT